MGSSKLKRRLKIYFKEDYRLFQQISFFLGIIGFIGHLLFFFVLQEAFGMWESFPVRLITAILFLSFLLLPRSGALKRWQIVYVELVLVLTFPLMFNAYAFMNDFSTYWSTGIVFSAFVYGILSNPSRSIILYPLGFLGSILIVDHVIGREITEGEILKSLQLNFQAYFIMFLISVFQSIINNAYSIIETERHRSDSLLENILPAPIVTRLKSKETVIADYFPNASIVFLDIQNFTSYSSTVGPERVVWMLNDIFSRLDGVLKKHGLEKIKTIGDCYMAASGLPEPDNDHARKAAMFAKDAMLALRDYSTEDGTKIHFRCGVDCGPVVAGVIGEFKFIYDVWGDAVNTAARMEHHCETDKIQVTERFMQEVTNASLPTPQVRDNFNFQERGVIEVKGKGSIRTYFLEFSAA